ncbi:hypothetical protein EJB05_09621, partial [Eragrostis curvula]
MVEKRPPPHRHLPSTPRHASPWLDGGESRPRRGVAHACVVQRRQRCAGHESQRGAGSEPDAGRAARAVRTPRAELVWEDVEQRRGLKQRMETVRCESMALRNRREDLLCFCVRLLETGSFACVMLFLTSRGNSKRPKGKKTPAEKPQNKSRLAESTEEITATMKSLRETLAATAPPQMPQLIDPHATLWQKLETIPMTSDQRVLVGEHLSSKENKGKRSWLCSASAETLHALVFKFLCEKESINMAPSLKSLRLIACQDIMEFEEEIKKFPLLEELEISLFTNIGDRHVFEEVGKACPQLKHFGLNKYRFYNLSNSEDTEDDNEYDDYCDPFRYPNGVYESELNAEDRMLLKGMRMLMKDSDDDDY